MTTALSMDRVTEIMSGFGVVLHNTPDIPGVAGANLNGHEITFAAIGTELIIRADSPTGQETEDGDPGWFVAANKFNTISYHAKAAIVDRTEQLVCRVEVEYDCQAGVTDEQLSFFLKSGVDTILTAAEAMLHLHDDLELAGTAESH